MLRNFLGPVDPLSANEAEVYALLIGCCELLSLESINTIIEGDSYSAIQWGSGETSIPWRLLDWMEEVQDISRCLSAFFHHILPEANVMVDALLLQKREFSILLRFFMLS